MSKYIPTIGIETHVQLKTKTKLFSAVGNDARQAAPNTLISHIDVGMPGALPVLNEKAVELTARAAFALNSRPQKFSKFDRKHYFYPDLPKGYQITQYDQPLIVGGYIEINSDGGTKRIGITRAHLEEDAGKNTHPTGADYSLVDLNRAGTPLLEIVSEPDIHSAAEAKAFARELYLLMKYADVSDVDLYQGHMRFDVNVSVSADPAKPGTRSETKNLNSFRAVEGAVAYEIKRQTELLQKGEKVVQETRGWDEAKQKTVSQRGKEEAHDYRYMPEPDIPPIELDDEFIEKIEKELPLLPGAIRKKLSALDVTPQVIEDIIDNSESTSRIIEGVDKTRPEIAKRLVFQLFENPNVIKVNLTRQIQVAKMTESNQLNSTSSKRLLEHLLKEDGEPEVVARGLNLLQVSDESAIEKIVQEVITENPQAAQDVKNGEMKAIGFLVGQVMAKSKGQANPGIAQTIIKKQLGI